MASIEGRRSSILEWFGGPKWAPNELPERGKIVKKACVFTCKLTFSSLQGLDLSKWLWRSSSHRRRSVLERFGGPKWAPKELPERRKIIKKACVFTVKLAFSRFGKDIIRDERFGLKKEAQNGSGNHWVIADAASWRGLGAQYGFQRSSQSDGKSLKKHVFLQSNWLFRFSRVLTSQNGSGDH